MLRRSGTAWCALGSFGGGFLGGDEVDVSVEVGQNAMLGLTTQAGPLGVRVEPNLVSEGFFEWLQDGDGDWQQEILGQFTGTCCCFHFFDETLDARVERP